MSILKQAKIMIIKICKKKKRAKTYKLKIKKKALNYLKIKKI